MYIELTISDLEHYLILSKEAAANPAMGETLVFSKKVPFQDDGETKLPIPIQIRVALSDSKTVEPMPDVCKDMLSQAESISETVAERKEAEALILKYIQAKIYCAAELRQKANCRYCPRGCRDPLNLLWML